VRLSEIAPRLFQVNYRLFLSWRYLRARLVNLISVAGVMAGVAVLIVVVSIMDGFQERVRRVTRGNLSDITLTPLGELPPFPDLERRVKEASSEVKAVSPQITVPVAYFYESGSAGALRLQNRELFLMEVVGIEWNAEIRVSDIEDYLIVARHEDRPFFDEFAESREKHTVLVSRRFVLQFWGIDDDHLEMVPGRDLQISLLNERDDGSFSEKSYNLIVSGVYDGQDVTQDVSRLFMDIDQLRKMADIGPEYYAARVKLHDYRTAEHVKHVLEGRMPGFRADSWEDIQRDFLQAVDNEKVLLVIVLSFIVLLGGFIILATLTLTVVEKTRDIGILSALGAPRFGVLSVFLWTGLWIGILGAALGVGLGAWFTANVNWVKDRLADIGIDIFPPHIYRFRDIPTVWDWTSVAWIAGGSIVMAFFAGLFPALRAANMDPVKALRHE
jgi:lipoprotein-releasing system permease protein